MCASGDIQSPNGTYNTSFVPAVLASGTLGINVPDLVSYIQSTELNSTTECKRSDPEVYTRENEII